MEFGINVWWAGKEPMTIDHVPPKQLFAAERRR